MVLDIHDTKILFMLLTNSRRPVTDIAKGIRLSKESAYYRLNRLIDQGYINNFFTLINAAPLGYQYYKVFLKVSGLNSKLEEEIIAHIRADKSCADMDLLEGNFNVSFLTMQKNPRELSHFMDAIYSKFGNQILDKIIITVLKHHIMLIGDSKNYEHKIIPYDSPGEEKCTEFERDILNKLARNARSHSVALSSALGSDSAQVRYHLKKLEKSGIIAGYSVSLNMSKFGKIPLQINFRLASHKAIHPILERLSHLHKNLWSYETIGSYDLCVKIVIDDMDTTLKQIELLREEVGDQIIAYEISYVRRNFIINLSPFEAVNDKEARIPLKKRK